MHRVATEPTLLIALVPAALACPDLPAEVERATAAVVAGDLEAAEAALAAGQASLGCAPADRGAVSRFWLAQGALRTLRGEDATPWLAASRQLDAEAWDPRFGAAIGAARDAAAVEGTATILLDPALPAELDLVSVAEWPAATGGGPHVVQVFDPDRRVLFGTELVLLPGEDALIPTGLVPGATEVRAELAEARPRKSPVLLIASGVAALGGGALAVGARAQEETLGSAEDLETIDGAWGRQRVFGIGAWSLWGAAVVGTTVHFVLP